MHIARESRRKVLIRAKMRAGGLPTEVCIRDVSSRGVLIQAAASPARGTYVELIVANQRLVGRVVWGKERRFGIQTRDPVNVLALTGGTPAGLSRRAEAPSPRQVSLAAARTMGHGARPLAKAMEFAAIGAFAAALVAAAGAIVFETLSNPFENISSQLRRG